MRLLVATLPPPHDLAQMLDERQVRRECRRAMRYAFPSRTWRRHLAANAETAANPHPTPENRIAPALVAQPGALSRERTSDDATHYTTVH